MVLIILYFYNNFIIFGPNDWKNPSSAYNYERNLSLSNFILGTANDFHLFWATFDIFGFFLP